jgi:hypothetical protein
MVLSVCHLLVNIDAAGRATQRGQEEEPVAISLKISPSEITPGQPITLQELLPPRPKVAVATISHYCLRIGSYNPTLKKLCNSQVRLFLHTSVFSEFDGLPGGLRSVPPTAQFDITTKAAIGFAFRFRAKRLGIYLIKASWTLANHEVIYSAPIVLVVKPPIDDKGQPIVKPEWLEEIPPPEKEALSPPEKP